MADKTYELVFYGLDGGLDSEQTYTDRETALEAFGLFDEPASAEFYSSIVLREYDWQTRRERELRVLVF